VPFSRISETNLSPSSKASCSEAKNLRIFFPAKAALTSIFQGEFGLDG
jgi:hypothetical protein